VTVLVTDRSSSGYRYRTAHRWHPVNTSGMTPCGFSTVGSYRIDAAPSFDIFTLYDSPPTDTVPCSSCVPEPPVIVRLDQGTLDLGVPS
jgi:hypothetical protein